MKTGEAWGGRHRSGETKETTAGTGPRTAPSTERDIGGDQQEPNEVTSPGNSDPNAGL